ncbi:carboxymuconolactone decarboxylase family protein [Mycolicibacterium sp. 018/SC-01/001]|uniref:carboxymuconolactone decarboxylase family protein n=1 Tax=Mycolicibacterium sp. 018/SC-01/001 TaxID=2592069 RepID=UPI00117C6ED2|nr:carboxymuconolactone decarboxylase family protein [Mycolicibacterium sp. 018/SC-01/001]TRW88315.1 carboxymuconolactone decarboxylase family protein [Mycolicibacterium sp. 018/SC-01/001]
MSDRTLPERLAELVAMSSGDTRADSVMRLTCGRALSLPPLPIPVDLVDERSDEEKVLAAFAEQFSTDVTGIGDNQRQRLLNTYGDKAFRVVAAVFVADFVPRVWSGCRALGLGKPGVVSEIAWDGDGDLVNELLGGFVPAVARLRELDAVTTEVVRLRGAAAHNCRLCKSLRETHALDAGGSEDLYRQIEDYESSEELTKAHKAALRYVDALIWTPSDISESVAHGIHKHFSETQAFELTLDVMRNAANKIAVALGADAPRVEEGTERYEVDEAGQTVFA